MTLISDIILPVFGLVVFGFVAGRAGWIKPAAIEGLSAFVFTFAIPVMLFRAVATAELPSHVPLAFLLAYYGSTLVLFLAALALGRQLKLTMLGASVFAMSATYSNVVLLGIPLVVATLGAEGTVPLFIIVSTHAAIMFVMTTLFAELRSGSLASLPLQTVKVLARNMIVVGLLAGLTLNLAGLSLPATLDNMAAYLGSAALPCAVFSMGASISLYRITGDLTRISLAVMLKNGVHPLLVWLVCDPLLELPRAWTAVAVVLAACPSGINAYLFANRYQAGVAATASVVVMSTLLSIPLMSLLLLLLFR
ncbi:MAG: AEC family transporter [Pseudomonadota bacterium]